MKNLFRLLMVIFAAALFSCTEDVPAQFLSSGATDTVFTLSTPSVTAKAFPGYNLVSWQPVPNNKGYEVYRYEDGNLTDKAIEKKFGGTTTFYEDTDVQNGVTYKYEIIALGTLSGEASRGVVALDSAVGSASCVGIMPPVDTSALDLAAYEGGYKEGEIKELSAKEDEMKLSTDTIESYIENGASKNELGRFAVRFPAKAYLDYKVLTAKGNEYDWTNFLTDSFPDNAVDTVVNNSYLTLTNLKANGEGITTSGKYTIYIKASSKNKSFLKYDIVKSNVIEVPELVLKSAPSITVAYKDENKDTIQITVNKLQKNDLEYLDTTDATKLLTIYQLYKSKSGEKDYKKVICSVTKNELNYFIVKEDVSDILTNLPDDTSKLKYDYMLVVTEGGKYCKEAATKEFTFTK